MADDLGNGLKTFFVYPDVLIMPKEDFLPLFYMNGFETYYLLEDQFLRFESQVAILARLFNEMLLFVNVNKKITGLAWMSTIARLSLKYRDRVRIGVLHREEDPKSKLELERAYLIEIGIQGGCIRLENDKAENRRRLQGVLVANEANGRRKALRMICTNAKFNFTKDARRYEGKICDVSISHFTAVFSGKDPELAMFSRFHDIQMFIPGGVCNVDAVVCGKRVVDRSVTVYVFVFSKKGEDAYGLDKRELGIVGGAIYDHFQKKMEDGLKQEYYRFRIRASEVPMVYGQLTVAPRDRRPSRPESRRSDPTRSPRFPPRGPRA
jgi:hypothetical protein